MAEKRPRGAPKGNTNGFKKGNSASPGRPPGFADGRLPLSPQKEIYCREFLSNGGNSGKAYMKAVGRTAYTSNTMINAKKYLTDPAVTARLQWLFAKMQERTNVTAEKILREYAKIGFADVGDIMSWGPNGVAVRQSEDLAPEDRAAVSEVIEGPNGTVKIKMHDKLGALNQMAKILGMVQEKPEVKNFYISQEHMDSIVESAAQADE